ncbi:hypothetical protein [Devosia chinhatensis]|uniref:hypothetical protein n=1 Tax=Devosia chinhatensis TaxID=429727 RepID=UPI000697A988|nr:hypothetical protein [Devosia chinhatensis]
MSLSKITLVAAALLAAPAGLALAQVPLDSLSSTVIEGRVGEVFGNRFILEDGEGRVLVEAQGELPAGAAIGTGDALVIVGTDTPNGFLASAITRQDGTEVLSAPRPAANPAPVVAPATPAAPVPAAAAAAPLDEAGARAAIEAMGFSDLRLDDRGRNHFEFKGRDADGRALEIEIALDGTLRKLDVDDDVRASSVDLLALLPDNVASAARAAGLVDLHDYEAGPRHFKLEGYTEAGHDFEIEFGLDGTLRKFDLDDDAPRDALSLTPLLPEGVQAVIAERGIVDVREFEVGPRHYKVEGYTEAGREIEVEIGFDDRVGAISVDDGRAAPAAAFDEAAIIASVEAAGYQVRDVEAKPRHVEVDAVNPEGETVRLHVDFAGEVYRERLVRQGF